MRTRADVDTRARLVAMGRAGLSWSVIGAELYPHSQWPNKAAQTTFSRIASLEDRMARNAALAVREKRGRKPGAARDIPVRLEPPLARERTDIFADMGNCFR